MKVILEMDNILETVQNEVQAEQSLGFHDDTEIGDMKKIEELKSDEEIDIQYASSQDSETDGSWEIPQKLSKNCYMNCFK